MFLDVVYVTADLCVTTAELVETFLLFFSQLQKSKKKTNKWKPNKHSFINEQDDLTDRDVVLSKDLTLEPDVQFQDGNSTESSSYAKWPNYLKVPKVPDLTMFSLSHGPGFKGRMCGFHYQATYNASLESKWLQNYTFFYLELLGKYVCKKSNFYYSFDKYRRTAGVLLLAVAWTGVWKRLAPDGMFKVGQQVKLKVMCCYSRKGLWFILLHEAQIERKTQVFPHCLY